MKLVFLLMLCALAAAAPKTQKQDIFDIDISKFENTPESRNILINVLVRQLFNYIRFVINNGSVLFGVPPLDPLDIEHFHIAIPPNNFLDFELDLENIYGSGLGGFVVHRSNLQLGDLTFDLDISVPKLIAKADAYSMLGHLATAFPLYGNGKAVFIVENFRFQCLLHLKISEDGNSLIIDRVSNPGFQLPSFKAELSGIIGGGEIDVIANAIVNEVIYDYIIRFEGAISEGLATVAAPALNPILEQLDTWKYLAPFV